LHKSDELMDRITAAKVFVSIAERGSMIAAADALDMSRAMVTRYLAEWNSGLAPGCCTGARAG
jgi:molybdenum-dependent DNA-binding transcriptional regulator ModE